VSGRKVPYWNQRALSSRHSSASSGFGSFREKRAGTEKPPMSTVQYGIPESEKSSPPAICCRRAVQVEVMSPDHVAAA